MRDEKLARLAATQPGDTLTCSCGAPVGTLQEVNSRLLLCVGAVTLTYAHGICCACNSIWHFDASDFKLARLIYRKGGERS